MDNIFRKLQVVKVGLFTKVQREENPKFVQSGQVCTLYPEGGVVWKIPYYLFLKLYLTMVVFSYTFFL